MTRKIDLDDLERSAKLVGGVRGEFAPATSTAVTLALIARIRELETLGRGYADCYEGEGYAAEAAEVRAVLDKGAIVP